MLKQEYGTANDFQKDFAKIKKVFADTASIWKMPQSHHVTQLFIGGDKSKA